MVFSERLISLMECKNLSAYKISKDTGIPQRTIGYWKTGTIPEGENLIKIAAYLDVTTDYLLGRVHDPKVELIPADPEKVRAHEEWLNQQHEASYKQLAEAIKKLPPDGEQPEREVIVRAKNVLDGLSDDEIHEVLRFADYVKSQRKQ